MDTITSPTPTDPDASQTQAAIAAQHARPLRDAASDDIAANARAVRAGLLQYVSEVFPHKEKPIAHTRIILGMCMAAELGNDRDRKKFLRVVLDVDGTSQLDHLMLSALYHWVKPFLINEDQGDGTSKAVWYANEKIGELMRKIVREDMDGTWTDGDGNPTQAAW